MAKTPVIRRRKVIKEWSDAQKRSLAVMRAKALDKEDRQKKLKVVNAVIGDNAVRDATLVGFDNIITKNAAREAGLKRFYTGVPCKHGHVAERYVGNGCCLECLRISHQK